MNEEIFDVVDSDDVIMKTANRAEVHDNGLLHRAVHVLLHDSNGRLFVQRRAFDKDSSPGLWDSSASGHVASGEDYDAAAPREFYEELGIHSATPLEFLFKLPAGEETDNEFVCVYRANSDEIPILDPGEVIAGRWVTNTELVRWVARERDTFTRTFLKICVEIGFLG